MGQRRTAKSLFGLQRISYKLPRADLVFHLGLPTTKHESPISFTGLSYKNNEKVIYMYKKIIEIIIQQVEEVNEELTSKIPLEQGGEAPLFGGDGVLNSLMLVTLIVGVEQAVEDELDAVLTLADEKAMSQKSSPFRTIKSLAEYVEKCIKGEI